jgi:hypothetical protein
MKMSRKIIHFVEDGRLVAVVVDDVGEFGGVAAPSSESPSVDATSVTPESIIAAIDREVPSGPGGLQRIASWRKQTPPAKNPNEVPYGYYRSKDGVIRLSPPDMTRERGSFPPKEAPLEEPLVDPLDAIDWGISGGLQKIVELLS